MAPAELLENGSDGDLLREMIGYTAQPGRVLPARASNLAIGVDGRPGFTACGELKGDVMRQSAARSVGPSQGCPPP